MKIYYYDIESLANVFTNCVFKPDENFIDVYILCDDQSLMIDSPNQSFKEMLLERIHACNANFNGDIRIYNLLYEDANIHFAKEFGLSDAGKLVNNPNSESSYPAEFRPVCDTDPDYDPDKHPYLMGYNSANYDTTMIAMYFYEVFDVTTGKMIFKPTTAKFMRKYNDELFSPEFKPDMPSRLARTFDFYRHVWTSPDYSDPRWRIRKAMMMSGRHLDVARLNEKQRRIALKRILGMMGNQILESDKLDSYSNIINNQDELFDLIAYNVSDVVNLKDVRDHKVYKNQFDQKRRLLKTYPDLVYKKKQDAYEPDISPYTVRGDRLAVDSTSARFASTTLCPYGDLPDIPAVSFMYPAEDVAKQLGIKRINVLDECKKFFYANITDKDARAKFDEIYNYYKNVEGKNFNSSDKQLARYPDIKTYKLSDLPAIESNMFYYTRDGEPTSCFVNFSVGGIHGAEYNKPLYDYRMQVYEKAVKDLEYVKSVYPDPNDLAKAKKILMPDFTVRPAKEFISPKTKKRPVITYKEIAKPQLFADNKLNKKFTFTSADVTNHEDFVSYYPNLLRQMLAFLNPGLGRDRYADIFNDKERLGKMLKSESLASAEEEDIKQQRSGTKLLLNSASGCADANYDNSILMNNTIISMRIIGQLFTWRIGQAQTLHGARITSTNTDGLFTVLEAIKNDKILAKESADIGVQIDPEVTYLISKDSNNRLEMNPKTGKIDRASGSCLAHFKGPDLTKSLAHPALLDWASCEYLIVSALKTKPEVGLNKPFDRKTGKNIITAALKKFDPVKGLIMFQNIVASSTGSCTYTFGLSDDDPDEPIIMQHYNRIFIVKDKTPGAIHIQSARGKKITPATKQKRQRNGEAPQQHNLMALDVLEANGVPRNSLPMDKEAAIQKVTNIDTDWYVLVVNESLHYMDKDRIQFIYDHLDYDKYTTLLENSFTDNWMNLNPPEPEPVTEVSDEEKQQLLAEFAFQPDIKN